MVPAPEKLLAVIATQGDLARLGPDLGAVMQLAAERVPGLTGADGAAVELIEGDEMVYRAVAGSAKHCLGLRVSRAHSLSGLCVQLGTQLRCDDADIDPRVDRAACRRAGLRSMLVLPLQHQGQTVGVIKAMAAQPAQFGPAEQSVLGLLAEALAGALFHASRNAASELYHRATHDPLTDLANRALFMDRLRSHLLQGDRDGQGGALLMIDMDGLKTINDRLGHRAGDAALIELGLRLSLSARVSDTVARLGGDEFGILLRPLDLEEGLAPALLRLRSAIDAPFQHEGLPLCLSASIGHALFPVEGVDAEALVELADRRMYADKRVRRGVPA